MTTAIFIGGPLAGVLKELGPHEFSGNEYHVPYRRSPLVHETIQRDAVYTKRRFLLSPSDPDIIWVFKDLRDDEILTELLKVYTTYGQQYHREHS